LWHRFVHRHDRSFHIDSIPWLLDGLDTVDANLALGRQIDERSYESVAAILGHLGGAQRRADDQHPG
jgi:hypothetical protein